MTKRNDEIRKRNNEIASDNTNFGMADLLHFFIFHKMVNSLDEERHQAIIYMFLAVNYFSHLSHVNILGVKIHCCGHV